MDIAIISKTFQTEKINIDIDFSFRETIYLNATKVAEVFNKDLSNWKRSKQTIQYIYVLLSSVKYTELKLTEKDLFKVVLGKGKDQGTWIHKSLIILFARWLSPEFAVWCDQQIEEILKSKSSQSSQPKENIDLDEILVISKKMLELASMFGLSRESRYLSADSGVERITGNSPLKLLGISQRISIEEMPRI